MKKNKLNRYAADLGLAFASRGVAFAQKPRKRQILPHTGTARVSGINCPINYEQALKRANFEGQGAEG